MWHKGENAIVFSGLILFCSRSPGPPEAITLWGWQARGKVGFKCTGPGCEPSVGVGIRVKGRKHAIKMYEVMNEEKFL